MSSIARLETTYAYNKQKVVIDVADMMNTEGYYEAIAMSPDGRIEYEVMHTKDRQEALDAFELYKLRGTGLPGGRLHQRAVAQGWFIQCFSGSGGQPGGLR